MATQGSILNQDGTPYKLIILVYIQYKSKYEVPNKRKDSGI